MLRRAVMYAGYSLFAAMLWWSLHRPAHGQSNAEVALGPIVRASAPGENISQVWAYADLMDGQHLIICGSFSYPQLNVLYGYVYSSPDEGASWRRALVDDSTHWVSEESCTYGENGQA